MNTEKRVLILGCGDLGQQLIALLPAENFMVTAVNRTWREFPPQVKQINLPIQTIELRNEKTFDAIFYMASPAARTEDAYHEIYIKGLAQAIEQARINQTRCFYLITSTAVYGQDDGEWVDETSETRPNNFNGKILLEAEELLANSAMNFNILRLSGIYGKKTDYWVTAVKEKTAMLSTLPQYTNRIHIVDAARFCYFLLQNSFILNERFIVSDDLPCERNQVILWLAEKLQISPEAFNTEISAKISGKRCRNQKLHQTGFALVYDDFRKGIHPVNAKFA